MPSFKPLLGVLVVSAGLSVAVYAQDHDHSSDVESADAAQTRFAQLDTNGDGMLSFEEFSAMPMMGSMRRSADGAEPPSREEMLERRFLQLDTNNDGLISAAEFEAGQRMNAQAESRRQNPGAGRQGQGGMQNMSDEQRARMRERMEQMTPEQRQQMRERMQQDQQRPMQRRGNQSGQ